MLPSQPEPPHVSPRQIKNSYIMVKTMWIGPKDPSNKVRKMRWRRVMLWKIRWRMMMMMMWRMMRRRMTIEKEEDNDVEDDHVEEEDEKDDN